MPKKYKDAEKLKSHFKNTRRDFFIAGEIKLFIDDVPDADVEEVKHGEWVRRGQDFYCSECNEEGLCNCFGASVFSKRCPNCGAKMDGKKGNKEEDER